MESNQEKLNRLYIECVKELNSIDITFEETNIAIGLSKRNNKRYGSCKPGTPDERYKVVVSKGWRKYVHYEHYQSYTIDISPWVMDLEEHIIKNTIIHELIHCLPYCNNHGKQFKEYATIINEKLGYVITRVGNKKADYTKSHKEYQEKEEYKYEIQCEKCGKIFYRQRLQKNFTRKYRCSSCLGKLKVKEK